MSSKYDLLAISHALLSNIQKLHKESTRASPSQ